MPLGSEVEGGEHDQAHRSCDICLPTSQQGPATGGPSCLCQPEPRAACPGWEARPLASHLGLLADQTAGSQEPPRPKVPLLEAKPLSGAGPEVRRARQQLTRGHSGPEPGLSAYCRHSAHLFPCGIADPPWKSGGDAAGQLWGLSPPEGGFISGQAEGRKPAAELPAPFAFCSQ